MGPFSTYYLSTCIQSTNCAPNLLLEINQLSLVLWQVPAQAGPLLSPLGSPAACPPPSPSINCREGSEPM